ncbi:MAG: threonine synthase [Treponema sp.]|nr:threonine synthase [Treponema sp.]
MRFTSTRNKVDTVGFAQAVLDCMPSDGGYYVPADTEDLRRWILYTDENTTFASIAGTLTSAFIKDEFSPIICETIATKAFPFEPVMRRLDDTYFMLELFHGPTGYHRDFGISYLVSCLETILQMRDSTAMFLSVTRAELGSVLAHELKDKKRIKAVVVYPKGTVHGMQDSDYVWNGGNIYPVEIEGSEADCRAFVRNIFRDHEFVAANRLTVANTANIGRLLPQAFFYPFAFSRLKNKTAGDIYYALAPGNYSNVVAGLYSWQFALPLNGFLTPATDALTVDAMGNCVLLDSVIPLNKRDPADPIDPSNLERLEDVFSANKLMMRNFIYPVKLTDALIDSAAKELFIKYHVYADRHTARAFAAAKANEEMVKEDAGTVVLVARDHPSLSADYMQHTLGEVPEMPENINAVLRHVSLNKPVIRTVEELRKIIIYINKL